jgi:hypothetical protein
VYRFAPLLCLISLAIAAFANADPRAERAELARRLRKSQKAVVGTVVDVQPRMERTQFGDVLIVSQLSIHVAETLRGPATQMVQTDIEGGTLGDYTMEVSDLPRLKPGARAVFLLLSKQGGGTELSERGAGILQLAADDTIPGSSLSLDDVREAARQVPR